MADPLAAACNPHWKGDGVEVISVDLNDSSDLEHHAVSSLSSEECARRQRFVCSKARRQFTVCRAALRMLLSERLGCRPSDIAFQLGPHGKPRAQVCGRHIALEFNVSHSGAYGVVAFSTEGPVGVDIEEMREGIDYSGIATTVFTSEEKHWLGRGSAEDAGLRFYRIWTLKEAVMKAVGRGFSLDPKSVQVPIESIFESGSSFMLLPKERKELKDQSVKLFTLPDDGYAAMALAVCSLLLP